MFGFKKKIKNTNLNFINGYASWISLICLFLTLQIVTLISLHTLQNAYILRANQQNILELSIMDHAKAMMQRNNRIRQCHINQTLEKSKDVKIMDKQVHFEDFDTYMDCIYDHVRIRIYYDDRSIVGIDIDEL